MKYIHAIGRRKKAIARVYMAEGKGNITINEKDYKEYFPLRLFQDKVEQPLNAVEKRNDFDVKVNVAGGGFKGQAEALRLGLARALQKLNPEHHAVLKPNDLLTRDPRQVERKKPGQPKARKKFQFSKR
ncbi:MAG: 30S ribosomal protein S9 [Bacteroidota bacterium]